MPLRGSAAKGREFAGAEIPAAACTKYGPRWFAGKNERRQNNSLSYRSCDKRGMLREEGGMRYSSCRSQGNAPHVPGQSCEPGR